MISRSLFFLAFWFLGVLNLVAQSPPVSEETIPLRYIPAIFVLRHLCEEPVPVGVLGQEKPVKMRHGGVELAGDPGTNTLTISGPAAEVTRLKAAAELLDVKPRQIILSAVIGHWPMRGKGGPGDCLGSQLPRWEWDRNQVPVNPDGTLKASAWRIGSGLSSVLNGLPNEFKVLSKPTIFTLHRAPANLSTGQRVWTLQANGPMVGDLGFEVVPTLQANGDIELDMQLTLDPQPQLPFHDFPHLNTVPFQTTITVSSGQTVYVGGIFLENSDGRRWELPVFISPVLVEDAAERPGLEN